MRYFGLQMMIFENRIAEYIKVFEKRKRRKSSFAGQNTSSVKKLAAGLLPAAKGDNPFTPSMLQRVKDIAGLITRQLGGKRILEYPSILRKFK